MIAGLVFALAACTATVPGTPLSIDTAGFQLGDGGCAGVGIPPFRIERDGDALRFVDVGTDDVVGIIWPFGFAARLQEGRAILYASDGVAIGQEGDVLDEIGACGSSDRSFVVGSVGARAYR